MSIISTNDTHMYNESTNIGYDYNTIDDITMGYNNKLLVSFTTREDIDDLISGITSTYNILYNKIFALEIVGTDDLVISYNIDHGNVTSIPENTILVHRKKDSNTLYTINALNELIKKLNDGVVDTKFPIDWQHYRNCILLTQHNELKQLNTKIHRIIEVK